MSERIPVEVGQLRRDPDPRMGQRVVRVVALDVAPVGEVGSVLLRGGDLAAMVEPVSGGRRSRVLLRRLERWEVVDPEAIDAPPPMPPAADPALLAKANAALDERVRELEAVLGEVLATFSEEGAPDYDCRRTGWVEAETVDRWRAVLRGGR